IIDTTKAQQIALDDGPVAPANHLKIGKCNQRLSSTLKSNEATIQVFLDTLKLTLFYKAFEVIANVPEIYMQEFWKFEDLPLEEEIVSFIRDLGHTGEIKVLTDVNVNHMHQPWRSFAAIINRCLSGKTTGLDSLCLSRAQIIWGMYHKKNVDYVYLLWEDLEYQVENKNSKKNNDMWYPRFTKDSEAYKQYYTIASRAEPPKAKTKYKIKADKSDTSLKKKTTPATKGSRLKTSAKPVKSVKKKQPTKKPITKGLTLLSEVALSEVEQLKMASKRSKIQFHSSHASGLRNGVDTELKVPNEQQ
ncbi:hypothetical protein Tco_1424556, partial [Tanacetum coccineum]